MNNNIVGYRHYEKMKRYRCLCCNKKIQLKNLLKEHKKTKRHKAFMEEFNNKVNLIIKK